MPIQLGEITKIVLMRLSGQNQHCLGGPHVEGISIDTQCALSLKFRHLMYVSNPVMLSLSPPSDTVPRAEWKRWGIDRYGGDCSDMFSAGWTDHKVLTEEKDRMSAAMHSLSLMVK